MTIDFANVFAIADNENEQQNWETNKNYMSLQAMANKLLKTAIKHGEMHKILYEQ